MSQADPNRIGERIAANGWKTGSVFSEKLTERIARHLQRSGQPPRAVGKNEWLIVVSQACDVVARKLSQEPYVEVLVAVERRRIDSPKAFLRSTRFLSFHAQPGGTVLEAHATDRFWIPRELLDGFSPDAKRSLSNRATQRVCHWLSLRYTRVAWPDALVKRLPSLQEMEVVFQNVANSLAELRVAITQIDEELSPGQPYRLTVFAVMDADEFETNPESRAACTKAFHELLDRLRRCKDIEVSEDSDFLSGDKFSWQLLQMTHEWNLANLTDQATA